MPRHSKRGGLVDSLWRRTLSLPTVISFLLAVGFLGFLVFRFELDLGETWSRVRGANPVFLAAGFLVHYTNFLFRGMAWSVLLTNARGRQVPTPGPLYCGELILLGWFANSIAWMRLGDAYRGYLFSTENKSPFPLVMGTIVSERLVGTALIVLLLLLCLPFLLGESQFPSQSGWAVLNVALLLTAILGLGLLALIGLKKRISSWLPEKLARHFENFYQGWLGSLGKMPWLVVWGLLGWLAEIARLYLVTLALGISLHPALVVFLTLANSLLTLVPTPGGLGAVESGVSGLLVRLSSVGASTAGAVVLLDRGISYLSVILLGGLLFLVRQVRPRKGFKVELEYDRSEEPC